MAVVNRKIAVGELKVPIQIQRNKFKANENGFPDEIWTTIATPRCKVDFDTIQTRQTLRDDGVDTTSGRLFSMRYIPNITTKDRIVYNGKNFEIYAIENVREESRYMVLWGREIEPTS